MTETTLPEWAIREAMRARSVFGVDSKMWSIHMKASHNPGGKEDADGAVTISYNNYAANIEINDSLQDNQIGREAVNHEIFHISFAELDQIIKEIIEGLPPAQQYDATQRYINASERFTTKVVRCVLDSLDRGKLNESDEKPANRKSTKRK
jgi:hypothetical protein